MLSTLFGLFTMGLIFGGGVIVGAWMLSKSNGGNNPVGNALRDFMAGIQDGMAQPHDTQMYSRPQQVELMPMEELGADRFAQGSRPGSTRRPRQRKEVVFRAFRNLAKAFRKARGG